MKIGFIGAGKVGVTLGKYMAEKGVPVAGYYSRSAESAREAAAFTGTKAYRSLAGLARDCDTLFLTVPDGAIGEVWAQVRALDIAGKHICHCSGCISSRVFEGIEKTGAFGYSVHPLSAVHSREESWKAMGGVYFTVEGDEQNRGRICGLIEALGNPCSVIGADKKVLYHAACVTVSNLMVGLTKVGADLFAECGLDEDFSQNAWRALFEGNARNICDAGIVQSLTGPVERGDGGTVRGHLDTLGQVGLPARDIYRSLSSVLVDIASQKHPERDYAGIKKELAS